MFREFPSESLLPLSVSHLFFSKCHFNSCLVPFLPLSSSHSGTTSTGQGTTSWAWPGLPKTSWPRSLTSSSPTWGPVGSSRHQHHHPIHRQANPSKPKYEERCGERFSESRGWLNWLNAWNTSISLKPLSMPCRRGSQWSFLLSGSCMSGWKSDAFEGRKSQWESVYFHCQAFLLKSGFFILFNFAWETWTSERIWIQAGSDLICLIHLMKEGWEEEMKER